MASTRSPTLIGVSGMDFASRQAEMEAIGFLELLRKPYELAVFLKAVRRHLPTARPGALNGDRGEGDAPMRRRWGHQDCGDDD